MVFCTYCGHSFTRDEHLERHILTHTNVKPFKCFTCHMSFARRDLLQRHYTVHGKDQNQEPIPAANGMIPKSAGRTPIACSNCAKTKTKCDKKFPCSRCAGRNLRCTLRPTRRSSKNANRMGLITPETLASGIASGLIPSDQNIGIEKAPTASSGASSPEQQHRPVPIKPASPKGISTHPTIPEEPNATDCPPPAPPSFEQSTHSSSPTDPHLPSPVTPTNGFAQATPLSGYEDFSQFNKLRSEDASPQFMLDWSQLQMPLGFDSMAASDLMASDQTAFDMNGMPLFSPVDPGLGIMPDMINSQSQLITPIESPKVERAFSDLDISGPRAMYHQHSRNASVVSLHSNTSHANLHDISAVVAAQDGWNVFRCTPTIPSSACPTTAKLNLERLEQTLKNHEAWSTWTPMWDDNEFSSNDPVTVMQLHESTRDKLLAITQSFLHKALETHRGAGTGSHNHSTSDGGSSFVLLPPTRVLEYFLRSYANCFERYYSLTSRGILDANELMHCYNDRASSLLILMMIAQGAMNIPTVEARWLTGGLIEACRISLFDLIERNIIMSADPIVLHAALLFTEQAGWSGDKWQMDIAMGQRGMYSYMLRHSGVLDAASPSQGAVDLQASPDQLWSQWIQQESRSRLIYSWTMVDQDLALFHDTAPLFSVTEFGAPMPDADRLWHAKSAEEWSSLFNQVHEFSGGYSAIRSGVRPLSLRDLFRHFLDDELASMGIQMTPLQMRLLLHPLQSMVCHYSQLISCFSDSLSSRTKNKTITASSTRCRLEEVQCLLQRWYNCAEMYLQTQPLCAVMQANLVMFHLISLNTVTNFAEIERLARREAFDGTYAALVWMHKRCFSDVGEALFHCGQVLRIVRAMPRSVRPPWWAGAIYRAALILWTDSLTNKDTDMSPPGGNGNASNASNASNTANGGNANGIYGPSFAIDALPADHPLVLRYLSKREGNPCLSKRDGSQVPMDHGVTVLGHCIEIIDEGASTRFSDGIRSKLDRLMRS